jgi:hypothetical protein
MYIGESTGREPGTVWVTTTECIRGRRITRNHLSRSRPIGPLPAFLNNPDRELTSSLTTSRPQHYQSFIAHLQRNTSQLFSRFRVRVGVNSFGGDVRLNRGECLRYHHEGLREPRRHLYSNVTLSAVLCDRIMADVLDITSKADEYHRFRNTTFLLREYLTPSRQTIEKRTMQISISKLSVVWRP